MLFKKLLTISAIVILSCGYSSVAQACEDKFSRAAFGSLEKRNIEFGSTVTIVSVKLKRHLWIKN